MYSRDEESKSCVGEHEVNIVQYLRNIIYICGICSLIVLNAFLLPPFYLSNSWLNATKFLTGASVVGSIAIPTILKHAGIIGWGALIMELSSFFVFVLSIMCFIKMDDYDDYASL